MVKIIETLVTTVNAQGCVHTAPFGIRYGGGERVALAPFRPSRSLDNLLLPGAEAVIHLSDNPVFFAACLTDRRDFSMRKAAHVKGWVLCHAVRAFESRVVGIEEDSTRPRIMLEKVAEHALEDWHGYNRAGMAIIEACIVLSRLAFLERAEVASKMAFFKDVVERSGGEEEDKAWGWLQEYYEQRS
ncbi:MAG: DUF447 family protein [Alphaproteobacteria bacterium GM7ARS4]|nr:DUF447 family protein [Alphaproteobacteria bacterium GM7ARS4]